MAAIYMWPVDNQILLTTTLYPVDVTDAIAMSITFTDGTMLPIPSAEITGSFGMGPTGDLVQLRWFYTDGPYDGEVAGSFGMGDDGTLVQLRWFYVDGPYDGEIGGTFGMGPGGALTQLVVFADTPDESLQLSITINDTCTMDLI